MAAGGVGGDDPASGASQPRHVAETVLPSVQLLSTPAPVLEHSSHAEIHPYSHNRLSWLKPTCLSETPKESGDRRVFIHNHTALDTLLGSAPPWPATGPTPLTSYCTRTLSHHRWHKWKLWPYHPEVPACAADTSTNILNPYVFSPPAFFFMYHRWRKQNGSLILFSVLDNYSNARTSLFFLKGTKKSAQISKANVIKQ